MPKTKKLTVSLNLKLGRLVREVDIKTHRIPKFVVKIRIIL